MTVPRPADIVITTPGGFPKDIDLYQSQKSMASSELVVKEGGTVILLAECKDGVGAHGFYEWMSAATCPQDVIDRFIREGYSIGASKAWLFSRCLKRSDLIVVSKSIDNKTLKEMFTQRADSAADAIYPASAAQRTYEWDAEHVRDASYPMPAKAHGLPGQLMLVRSPAPRKNVLP